MSLTARNTTVAVVIGVGSFVVYSLYKALSSANDDYSSTEILDFWFGPNRKKIDGSKRKLWFMGGVEFDNVIKNKYGAFMEEVLVHKKCDHWRQTALGCLALILISDQFTRNAYRNTARMFAYDSYARELTMYAIEKKYDEELLQLNSGFVTFLYMPLMHSEDIEDQRLLEQKYKWCAEQGHPFPDKYRKEHMDIIRLCGRFPQRNQILGRKTTEKEKDVMEKYNLMRLVQYQKK